MTDDHEVAILGAGIGGLGMAARLRRQGRTSFVVLEKAGAVGGTWRENTCPGAACDVQSHLYWYSVDDQQPDWTRLYAQQPEIQGHVVRDDVSLVTERIERVEEDGIRTSDGTPHEFDVIVLATGFETLSFLGSPEILGRGGRSQREEWQDGARAHLGMTVSGFPDLFLLYGPNTNLGHNSIILVLEAQYDYVLQALRILDERGGIALDVREEAQERYNRQLQDELSQTSFAGGCTSRYKTADGHITNNWSGSVEEYRAAVRDLVLDDYPVLEGAPA